MSFHFLSSWMTVLMLAACIPSCLLLCEGCSAAATKWQRAVHHVALQGGMLGGMAVSMLDSSLYERMAFLSPLVASHVSMLLGMVSGLAIVGWMLSTNLSKRVPSLVRGAAVRTRSIECLGSEGNCGTSQDD